MRILVIEDDPTSRTFLNELLQSYGEVELAEDGVKGLKAVEKAYRNKNPYDLICLDIMMPGLDGHGVLKKIRELEEKLKTGGLDGCKIIMTTALNDSKTILAAFNSQCEAYLTKPIDKNKLFEEMKKLGLIDGKGK